MSLSKMKIILATLNEGKCKEMFQSFSGSSIQVETVRNYPQILPWPEETGTSFEENARIKVQHVWSHLGGWVLADDSGLQCDDLGGAPGIYSARYAGPNSNDELNNLKLMSELKKLEQRVELTRRARYICVLVLKDPFGKETIVTETCEGLLLSTPRGQGGFGYDPYFYLPEWGQSMAEIAIDEKNKISHRGKALRKLASLLPSLT